MMNITIRNTWGVAIVLAVLAGVMLGGLVYAADRTPETETTASDVVVRVGERAITRATLDMRKQRIAVKRRKQPDENEMTVLADLLVEQTLFAEGARAAGLDQDPQVRVLIEDTVDKLLAELFVHRQVLADVRVSQSEVAEYYKAHAAAWRRPEQVRARHILLRVGPQMTSEEVRKVENRALEIRRRLAAGEEFVQLAKTLSEDTGTKKNGGDLGFFDRKGKTAALADAAFALKSNEVSQPVRSSVGYHIIQLLERRPPGTKSLEEVSGQIRSHLLGEKRVEAAKTARRRLEKELNLYIAPSLLTTEEKHANQTAKRSLP
jgi:parvulin-like peptidyl-prolyl isomerase